MVVRAARALGLERRAERNSSCCARRARRAGGGRAATTTTAVTTQQQACRRIFGLSRRQHPLLPRGLFAGSGRAPAASLPASASPFSASQPLRCPARAFAGAGQAGGGHGGSGDDAATFTLTTPLYYANASPHMGSAYPTMAADALARYYRLRGRRVRFVTGTDEHGEKIAESAEARGLSPQAHVDAVSAEFRALWDKLDIRYDAFVRTTEPDHGSLVREVIEKVWERGDIYKARYVLHSARLSHSRSHSPSRSHSFFGERR